MELLREKWPEAPTNTVWKDYYDKGHEISLSGTYCVNCNGYVVDMSECFQIPECEGAEKMSEPEPGLSISSSNEDYPLFAMIERKYIDTTDSPTIALCTSGRSLLKILRDGTVEASTLENACLAGKMFVESIRHHIGSNDTQPAINFTGDEVLNKTEDLHLLSKILDVMKDDDVAKAVSLIHTARKSDRNFIERLQREIVHLKEEHREHLLNVSTD